MWSNLRRSCILADRFCKPVRSSKRSVSLELASSFDFESFFAKRSPGLVLKRSFCTDMEGKIVHDEENKVFFVQLTNDGGRAVLDYEKVDSKTLDFYHTGVPGSHRGQGIAKHLVKAGFDFAISEKLKVIPTCSYVLKYVNEHLEEKHAKNNVLMS